MKKDIEIKKVEGIAVAVVPLDEAFWEVHLINFKEEPLKNVLINTKGYGEIDDKPVETTTLRYFFEEIPADCSIKIEPLQKELLDLTNEYWVSFQLNDGYLFDKRYIFVRGSIDEMNFTFIPYLEMQGVMIK